MTSSFKVVLIGFVVLIMIILTGSLAFMKLENFSFPDAIWLTVITLTTVGFGDIVPVSPTGRLVALLLVICGVWLFTYVLSNIFSGLLEGQLIDIWGKRKMINRIKRLKNHIVVCGAGRVGHEVIMELLNERSTFVVLEKDEQKLQELQELGVLFIAGDATEDKNLQAANIETARGVIITLPEDAGNLFVTISCKNLNPGIRVITRANRPENQHKIKMAGADSVICPSAIAGNRMALSAIKPASVAYVQTLVETRNVNLELEELVLNHGSPLAGLKLKDSGLREKFGALVLAIKRDDIILVNPGPGESLLPGDTIIVCGSAEKLSKLESLAAGTGAAAEIIANPACSRD